MNPSRDKLLKREFNHYRLFALNHPIIKKYSLDAIPFFHEKIIEWQDTINGGITFHHRPTHFVVTSVIDDLWVNSVDEVIVVDYKGLAVKDPLVSAAKWLKSCQRQLDIYAWLLQKNKFNVHNAGYFLYCDGKTSQKKFNVTLNFDVSLIPHKIDTSWIEDSLQKAYQCLKQSTLPSFSKKCQFCKFLEETQLAPIGS